MANRLGVTTPAVNKWENGNSKPDIELLAPIARLFLRKKDYTQSEKYLNYFSDHDPMKTFYQGRLYQEQGKIEEAYEKYENVIFSEFSTLNLVLSMMAGLALQEDDIGYARFLSEKVQSISHILEMGKYNEYSPMLDIVCAGKDV